MRHSVPEGDLKGGRHGRRPGGKYLSGDDRKTVGESEELRARKLKPGERVPPEEVVRNQRERLFAAMVAVCAEHGYEATTVADLVALSGVSRAAFYRLFANKKECFLARSRLEESLGRKPGALVPLYDGRGSGLAAFVELIVAQPAAARMCFVDTYAAGPEAVAALDLSLTGIEHLVTQYLEKKAPGTEIPAGFAGAIIAGMRKVIYTRLWRGREAELTGLVDQLRDWSLGYVPPPKALRRRRIARSGALGGLFRSETQVDRMMAATLATMTERGYQATTVEDIAKHASVSLTTFHEHFDSKEDIFIAVLDAGKVQLFARTLPAFQRSKNWPEGVRAAFEAMFAFFAAEPAFARVAMIEVLAAGTTALDRGDRTIEGLERFLGPGYELEPTTPPIAAEAIGEAICELLYRQAQSTSQESLRGSIAAKSAAWNRGPTALDAGAVELRRSETSRSRLLVAIGQSERSVAVALDVGLRRLGAKLLSAGGKLPRRLGGSLQALLHQLKRPSLLVGNVGPRMSCHRKKCSRGPQRCRRQPEVVQF